MVITSPTSALKLCGIGVFRPEWLQRFATTKCFLLVFSFLGTIQSSAIVYWLATSTTFEKRFKIPSKTTGYMLSGNEISQVLLSLFLAYFGTRNRPLWLAWGVAFSATSCFVLALPHFLYGPGESALGFTKEFQELEGANGTFLSKSDSHSVCMENKTSLYCGSKTGGEYSNMPAFLVFLSQFILGIGTTLYYSLGQTYIDDNSKKTNTPFLLGLAMSLRTIGPVLGFAIGSFCLKLYIDPSLTPTLGKDDPNWLGAWWLGWIILGSLMFLFCFLFALFPKNIPKPEKSQDKEIGLKEKKEETDTNQSKANTQLPQEKAKPTFKEFPTALKRIATNKLLMVDIFSTVFYLLGGSGFITYFAKYFEVQFNTIPSQSSQILGPLLLSSFVCGFLASGWIISKFKPRSVYVLGWNVVTGCFSLFCLYVFTFLSCPDNNLASVNTYDGKFDLINDCNRDCECIDQKFAPMCYKELNITFFSACHAGCRLLEKKDGKMTFSNCTCIPQLGSNDSVVGFQSFSEPVLTPGACEVDCIKNLTIFLVLSYFFHLSISSGKIGNILVNFRAVQPEDKSIAQGLALLLISLLAFIPGPIVFGYIIDSTCIAWNESCGITGNCLYYDKRAFRERMNFTSLGFNVIGVILDCFVCYLGKDIDFYKEVEPTSPTNPPVTNGVEPTKPKEDETEDEENPLRTKTS